MLFYIIWYSINNIDTSRRWIRNNIAKIPLFAVGVDSAKELLYSRLKIKEDGAGYCHFPKKYFLYQILKLFNDEYYLKLIINL